MELSCPGSAQDFRGVSVVGRAVLHYIEQYIEIDH